MLGYLEQEWNVPRFLSRFAALPVLVIFLCALIFRVGWVDFVDNYEIGYKYDRLSGEIEVLQKKGYILTLPFLVNVHTVDLRPMQVCINANARILNCKLVQFDATGLELFLSWHGRSDYASGSESATATSLDEILKGYAYEGSGKSYPFLRVIRELKPGDDLLPEGGAR